MEQKRLGDIATYVNGYPFKPEDRGTEGLPIIRIQDLTGNAYDLGYYSGDYPERIEINDGDVLISWSASLGVYVWDRGKALLNQHIFKVLFDKEQVDKQFFVFAVQHKLKEMETKTHGATMKHIVKKDFDNTRILFPSIKEQEQISKMLMKASTIVTAHQQELKKLEDLIKARFVEMFGDLADPACKWGKCRLVDACENSYDIKCGPFGTQLGKDEYTEEGVAVWEIPQINSEFKTLPTHFVTEKKAAELDAYSIIPGDIAMSRKGNVGRCAVFPSTFEKGIIHSDVLRIRLDDTKAFPEFMMRQLHYSGDIQHQIELVSSGAIMAGINVTKLKQIFVYLPPIGLQGKYVSFVAQVDKSKVVEDKPLWNENGRLVA